MCLQLLTGNCVIKINALFSCIVCRLLSLTSLAGLSPIVGSIVGSGLAIWC